ncbi:hypothetical protein KRR38_31225 [Novosphingobium sp. G106]|uniref:hypothetical protein n=1 Tax=Novosphingobium sp. G106 TaxID=2849500 RepID=UPI001C2D8452|nr:hypothetical protein [Novosphingobium sp. G106]MBV1692020.1 hypothetical protein [Novosphingobium sp. G106]
MTFKTLIALVACFSLCPPVHAKEQKYPSLRFAAIESDYQWDNDLEHARGTLARAVPVGLSFWAALDILEKAGARCMGDRHDAQIARCVYPDWTTVHDYYRASLFWTVVVRLKEGKVVALALDRVVDEK